MAKYKFGDVLVPKIDYQGFRELTVIEERGDMYVCKIINGTATILKNVVDENYEFVRNEEIVIHS